MARVREFEFKLMKFVYDYCFGAYMINLRASDTRDIRIQTAKRSAALKYAARVTLVALFAIKLLQLVRRMATEEVSSYSFVHVCILLQVATGLFCATSVIIKDDVAVAFFAFQHSVCQKFRGKSAFQ